MNKGFTLIELLVSVVIFSIIGIAISILFIDLQARSTEEFQKNELVERANRISSYLIWELREAGFGVSATPKFPDGSNLTIGGVTYSFSIIPQYNPSGNDSVTIIKGISFLPKLKLGQNAVTGSTTVILNRTPTNYEVDPLNDYKSLIVFESHKKVYKITSIGGTTLTLSQGLTENVSAGTEVFGVRIINLYVSKGKLLRNDGITSSIIDENVDGLKFLYILEDGSEVQNPANPADIRAVKFFVLLKSSKPSKKYMDTKTYNLGGTVFGPFNDKYRRLQIEGAVEVKNVSY